MFDQRRCIDECEARRSEQGVGHQNIATPARATREQFSHEFTQEHFSLVIRVCKWARFSGVGLGFGGLGDHCFKTLVDMYAGIGWSSPTQRLRGLVSMSAFC